MKFSDLFKKGFGAPSPSDLLEGGIGIDVTNKKMYSKSAEGVIFQIGLTDEELASIMTAISNEVTTRSEADTTNAENITNLSQSVTTLDGANVKKTSVQALHATDVLRLSDHILSIYKGDGTFENITLPASLYDAGHSFASSGYMKFANGLKIQWKKVTAGTSTWPIAFVSACYSAQVSIATAVSGTATNTHQSISATATSFTVSKGVDVPDTFYVFGIGY